MFDNSKFYNGPVFRDNEIQLYYIQYYLYQKLKWHINYQIRQNKKQIGPDMEMTIHCNTNADI